MKNKKVTKDPKLVTIEKGGPADLYFFVRVRARNGKILMSSEILNTKAAAIKNATAAISIFSDVKTNKLAVIDEQGHKWMMQKSGKLYNSTTVSLARPIIRFITGMRALRRYREKAKRTKKKGN